MKKYLFALCAFAALCAVAKPDPELAKRQARSVHLIYMHSAKEVDSIKVNLKVTESQMNSYFCALSWDGGYCGVQERWDGKWVIFSVWDPGSPLDFTAKEGDVPVDIRANILYAGEGVEASRFQGEGTGAKSMKKYGWKVGEEIGFKIDVEPCGTDRVAYTCSLFDSEKGDYVKLASISTMLHPGMKAAITNFYSFVEDFWRNYYSATLTRSAEFSGVSAKTLGAETWEKCRFAYFSADTTPSKRIDAGKKDNSTFFLKTGGDTKNEHAKLWTVF